MLDTSNRLLVVDFEDGREVLRRELSLEKMSLLERIETISRLEVRKVICAAISETMSRLMEGKKIGLVCGVVGELEKIIQAYLCDQLDDACFSMPGKQKPGSKKFPQLFHS
ncbi:MAG: hypothetical protein V1714_04380 [Pseudomonadota bacterium]